jgi:hypothetical protein
MTTKDMSKRGDGRNPSESCRPSMQWQSTSPRLLRAARISMIAHTAGMDVEYHVIAPAMVGLRLCPSSRPT